MNSIAFAILLGVVHSATLINGQNVFNVMDHGAKGDGVADDTNAFKEAWRATCAAAGVSSTMVVPSGYTFLVLPINFEGHCNSSKVNLQILGTIVAPATTSSWNKIGTEKWLEFYQIEGLSVTGPGALDGRGQCWWDKKCNVNHKPLQGCYKAAPVMVMFVRCTDLQVDNLNFTNSPQMHVVISDGIRNNVTNLRITSPVTSPNTDGIHVANSQHVRIENTVIGTGDDCISIGDKTSDLHIERIECGPGHGISVGSLGMDGADVSVENIEVRFVNFYGTTNGARIKTWQGGKGFARSITFENITFSNVSNPIIIDQYYCDVSQVASCTNQPSAVKISDITYANLQGTSQNPTAVTFNCSQSVSCDSINVSFVNITSTNPVKKAGSVCINAKGISKGYLAPDVACLHHD